MLNRRGFFGGILGLFGLGNMVKAGPKKQPPPKKPLVKDVKHVIYAVVHRKCELFAQSEFQVYKKTRDGRRLISHNNASEGGRPVEPYKLVELLEKPNSDETWNGLAYQWLQQLSLTGTSLTWMVPNKLSTPHELF